MKKVDSISNCGVADRPLLRGTSTCLHIKHKSSHWLLMLGTHKWLQAVLWMQLATCAMMRLSCCLHICVVRPHVAFDTQSVLFVWCSCSMQHCAEAIAHPCMTFPCMALMQQPLTRNLLLCRTSPRCQLLASSSCLTSPTTIWKRCGRMHHSIDSLPVCMYPDLSVKAAALERG